MARVSYPVAQGNAAYVQFRFRNAHLRLRRDPFVPTCSTIISSGSYNGSIPPRRCNRSTCSTLSSPRSPNRTRFARQTSPSSTIPPAPEPHVPGHLPQDVEAENDPPIEVIQLVVNDPVQGNSTLLLSLFGFPLAD